MRKKRPSVSFGLLAIAISISVLQLTQAAGLAASKKRILYLGDSMSMGAFGRTMDQEMRAAGHEVYTFVAGGATPYYWLSRYSTIKGPIGYWEKTPSKENRQSVTLGVPKVEDLLEKFDPDIVVIQTGTNLYATLRSKRRSKENNVKEVEGLLNHMVEAATQGGRRCYWISPPQAHPGRYPVELQVEMAELTKRVVSPEAKYFDSRSVTTYTDPYPKNDGIHYGPTEAKQWAAHVIKDFSQFVGDESRIPHGMLAGQKRRKSDAPPVNSALLASVPRAIPVAAAKKQLTASAEPAAEPIQVEQAPPEKPKKKRISLLDSLRSPSKREDVEPGSTPEKKRPPVQFVKKAIPLEMDGEWGKIDLEVELVAKSQLKTIKDIDYSYCFAMNEYKVLKVNSGEYPHDRIRIARVVMWSKRLMQSAIQEEVGHRPKGGWSLVPMSRYPRFEKMQMVDDLPIDLDLPVYIIAFE